MGVSLSRILVEKYSSGNQMSLNDVRGISRDTTQLSTHRRRKGLLIEVQRSHRLIICLGVRRIDGIVLAAAIIAIAGAVPVLATILPEIPATVLTILVPPAIATEVSPGAAVVTPRTL